MEVVTKVAWLLLALIHASPAMVFFAPRLIERLYSTPAEGPVVALLVHRGALFLAIFVAALYAAFDPHARRLAAIVVAISMVAFLWVYWRAGMPQGALRTIALVDLVGLLPLALVVIRAWA